MGVLLRDFPDRGRVIVNERLAHTHIDLILFFQTPRLRADYGVSLKMNKRLVSAVVEQTGVQSQTLNHWVQ